MRQGINLEDRPVQLASSTMLKLLVAVAGATAVGASTALGAYYGVKSDLATMRAEFGTRLAALEQKLNIRAEHLAPLLLACLLLCGCAARQSAQQLQDEARAEQAKLDLAHGSVGAAVGKAAATVIDAPATYKGEEQPPYFAAIHGLLLLVGAGMVVAGVVLFALGARGTGATFAGGGVGVALAATLMAFYGKALALVGAGLIVVAMAGAVVVLIVLLKRTRLLDAYLQKLVADAKEAPNGHQGAVLNVPSIEQARAILKPKKGE